MRISKLRHPEYRNDEQNFEKWRLTYQGGDGFICRYLQKFSKREGDVEFAERKALSYLPAFAKAAVNKMKNTMYSRMGEIRRLEGPPSYREAIEGKGGGVDLYGCSMDTFMGQDVLAELMTMRRVGIFIDKPGYDGNLLARNIGKKPYLYAYCAEDILSWRWTYCEGEYIYTNVLLRDTKYKYDKETGLVESEVECYRHLWLGDDGVVHIQFYEVNPDDKADYDIKVGEEIVLDMPRLPFVVGELRESLLVDIADYQRGMLNLSSADMNYCYKANFPFYTEQFDPASESIYTRGPLPPQAVPPATSDTGTGTALQGSTASPTQEVRTGAMTGRKYPKGMDRPEFIAPPVEPLIASMKKQDQMKSEIYELIDLAVSRAQPMHASAESKQMDSEGVESGLSCIGLELQYMENEISKIWALYENKSPAVVNYPKKYTLKSDADRIAEAKAMDEVKTSIPSKKAAKEVSKQIAEVLLVDKVTTETLEAIKNEIDAADYVSADPTMIQIASELGMVDAETGSNALGFDGKKVVPLAQAEHAKRLAEIAASQANGAARGVGDKGPIKGAKQQSKNDKGVAQKAPDLNPNPGNDGTRGAA